jgi:hypothetical protein
VSQGDGAASLLTFAVDELVEYLASAALLEPDFRYLLELVYLDEEEKRLRSA